MEQEQQAEQPSSSTDAKADGKVGQKRERAQDEDPMMAPVPDEMSLPSAAIMRIIKAKLPEGIMINKDAKAAFAKACSIFILYLTVGCVPHPAPLPSHRLIPPDACPPRYSASDISKETRRTTINAQDVITALKDLEFDDFVPNLEMCLAGQLQLPAPPPARTHTPSRRPLRATANQPTVRAQPSARPRRRRRSSSRRSGRRACRSTAPTQQGRRTSARRATWSWRAATKMKRWLRASRRGMQRRAV